MSDNDRTAFILVAMMILMFVAFTAAVLALVFWSFA